MGELFDVSRVSAVTAMLAAGVWLGGTAIAAADTETGSSPTGSDQHDGPDRTQRGSRGHAEAGSRGTGAVPRAGLLDDTSEAAGGVRRAAPMTRSQSSQETTPPALSRATRRVAGAANTSEPYPASSPTGPIAATAAPVVTPQVSAGPITVNPNVAWDAGLLRGTVGATSSLPLNFTLISAPSLDGKIASDNSDQPIFGEQGQFTYLPYATTLTAPTQTETFKVLVAQTTPFDKWLTGLPLIGSLLFAPLLTRLHQTPIIGNVLAPVIGTSQVVTFTENPAALAAGRPTAFDFQMTSFDGTEIHLNYFPAVNVANGTADTATTLLYAPGLGAAGYTDPDSLSGQPENIPVGEIGIPGITVFRQDALPGVYTGSAGGYNVITWDDRGTYSSGGQMEFDNPFYEGRDASSIIDWTTSPANPAAGQIRTDLAGVPLIGMVGGSYGGAIQLSTASTDPRIKALVPAVTWNSLIRTLQPNGQFKSYYGALLVAEAALYNLRWNPQVFQAVLTGILGRLSESSQAFLESAGPTVLLNQLQAPTLLIQGISDTLTPLAEAVASAQTILANPYDTPVKMLWACTGHFGSGCFPPDTATVIPGYTLAWLDQYLAGAGTPADAIPTFSWYDAAGGYHTSDLMPFDPGFNRPEPLTATREGGTLGIVPVLGGSGNLLATAAATGFPFLTPASNAVSVPITVAPGTQVAGQPTLSFTYRGLGSARSVYAQMVATNGSFGPLDLPRAVLGITTAVPVTLDGRTHTVSIPLDYLAAGQPDPGYDLELQITSSCLVFEDLTAFGVVDISDIRVDIPVVAI